MLITGHQPNYIPYAGFFHKIIQAEAFVIVDNVQFVKRGPFGWIHRNKIRTQSGWEWLTVPVITKGKFSQKINETIIGNKMPWRRKHWKAIEFNYRKAPHFDDYALNIERIYQKEWASLCQLNVEIINLLLDMLGIKIKIYIASKLGISGKASELVIDMCKKLNADTYLSGVHGRDYLDETLFEKSGIKLIYQDFKHPEYKQCQQGDFVPNLSVIDMLFNCGKESLNIISGKKW